MFQNTHKHLCRPDTSLLYSRTLAFWISFATIWRDAPALCLRSRCPPWLVTTHHVEWEKLPSICQDLQGEFDWNHCNYELLFDQEQGRTYWLLWEGQILLEIDTQFFLFLVEELWIWGKNGRGLPLWEVQLITPGIVLSVRDRQMAFQVGENILNLLIGHPGGGKSTRGSKANIQRDSMHI